MTNPHVVLPDLCRQHQRRIVAYLHIPETGPWRVALYTAGIMLFQAATGDDRVWQRCSPTDDGQRDPNDLSLVLAEIGCLACFKPEALADVLKVMGKGLSHAALVSQGKLDDPDWTVLRGRKET